jgi:hypothetical protein
VTGKWFSPYTLISSTNNNKTVHLDIQMIDTGSFKLTDISYRLRVFFY